MSEMAEQMLTIQQVMAKLQVADETVYRYIRNGKLKAARVGGLWRITPGDLESFMKRGDNSEHNN
jgi:excisionase family DNA binding protein